MIAKFASMTQFDHSDLNEAAYKITKELDDQELESGEDDKKKVLYFISNRKRRKEDMSGASEFKLAGIEPTLPGPGEQGMSVLTN